jgi:hypothetical protein
MKEGARHKAQGTGLKNLKSQIPLNLAPCALSLAPLVQYIGFIY